MRAGIDGAVRTRPARRSEDSTFEKRSLRKTLRLIVVRLPRFTLKGIMTITVLLVEPNSSALSMYTILVESAGYQVVTTHDMTLACKLLREQRVDVLVTKLAIDKVGGAFGDSTYARVMKGIQPDLCVIFADGLYPSGNTDGMDTFLQTPFTPAELKAAVESCLSRPVSDS